jgi:poly(3-hydroxybutyrate) depolymerase
MNPPNLPSVMGSCPTFTASQGTASVTVSAGGGTISAQLWAGPKSTTGSGGPLIIWWHGTASSPSGEIPISLDTNAIAADGGIVAGFVQSSRTGATSGNTGDAVWYTSDGAFADQVVACAIRDYHIDPRRIHTAGYSAGGLQTVWMWFARSGYLASVISYSGGDAIINKAPMQDSSNYPAAIAAHGAAGSDSLGVDFANASATWEMEIKQGGGFSIDCNDGGNHLDFFGKRAPPLKPVAYQFFKDHPFGVKPEPYTSLPSGFPTYCKID